MGTLGELRGQDETGTYFALNTFCAWHTRGAHKYLLNVRKENEFPHLNLFLERVSFRTAIFNW